MKKELLFHSNFNSYWFDGVHYYEQPEATSPRPDKTIIQVDRERVMDIAVINNATQFVIEGELKFVSTLATAMNFFKDKEGKVMILKASSSYSRDTMNHIVGGIIHSVDFFDETDNTNVGFKVQLKERDGKLFYSTENFFGIFKSFEVINLSFSDVLKITYMDGSYFNAEIRI